MLARRRSARGHGGVAESGEAWLDEKAGEMSVMQCAGVAGWGLLLGDADVAAQRDLEMRLCMRGLFRALRGVRVSEWKGRVNKRLDDSRDTPSLHFHVAAFSHLPLAAPPFRSSTTLQNRLTNSPCPPTVVLAAPRKRRRHRRSSRSAATRAAASRSHLLTPGARCAGVARARITWPW